MSLSQSFPKLTAKPDKLALTRLGMRSDELECQRRVLDRNTASRKALDKLRVIKNRSPKRRRLYADVQAILTDEANRGDFVEVRRERECAHGEQEFLGITKKSSTLHTRSPSSCFFGTIDRMDRSTLQAFGERLRRRISAAGISNQSEFLIALGISGSFISDLCSGKVRDGGIVKIARIAEVLGIEPSHVFRDLDDILDSPGVLTDRQANELGIAGYPEKFDRGQLSLVVDVLLRELQGANAPDNPSDIGAIAVALYQDLGLPDAGLRPVEIRAAVLQQVLGFESSGSAQVRLQAR